MPPKRKKDDDADGQLVQSKPSTNRATRSSTRNIAVGTSSNQTPQASSSASVSNKNAEKGTASKRSGVKKTKQSRQTETVESSQPPAKKTKKDSSNKAKTEAASLEGAQATVKGKSSTGKVKHPVYAKSRMKELFEAYADTKDPSHIDGDGLERLCTDGNISMDGSQPLILAWFLQASESGKFTKDEWLKGCDALRIDTLEKLSLALAEHENQLIFGKTVPSKGTTSEPYNRCGIYGKFVEDVPVAFDHFYKFVFLFFKKNQERNIQAETARALWSTILAPKYPMVNDFVDYIEKHATLKGVNKDLWAMVLEFFRSGPSLENYEAEGAWPTVIDDFVSWRKSVNSNCVG